MLSDMKKNKAYTKHISITVNLKHKLKHGRVLRQSARLLCDTIQAMFFLLPNTWH